MNKKDDKKTKNYTPWESVNILISRWLDGSFTEIIDDWKWIFSYSARYKGAILFYIFPRKSHILL